MRLFGSRVTTIAFVMVLGLLSVNALVASINTARVRNSEQLLERTYHGLRLTDELIIQLLNFETGIRGFILTGETRHLAPSLEGVEAVPRIFQEAVDVYADNPNQLQRLVDLAPLIHSRIDLGLKAMRTYVNDGGLDAVTKARTGVGRIRMEEIRKQIATMNSKSLSNLADQTRSVQLSYYLAQLTSLITAIISIVLAVAAWGVIEREMQGRIALEQKSQASSEHFRVTLHSIGEGVVVTDISGRITLMNEAARAMTQTGADVVGRPVSQVLGLRPITISAPGGEDSDHGGSAGSRPVQESLRLGTIVHGQPRRELRRPDGTSIPVDEIASPIRDARGSVTGSVLVFRDMSGANAAERIIRSREERFRRTFEGLLVGMALCDRSGRIVEANGALLRMLGLTREGFAAAPLTLLDITPADYAEIDRRAAEQVALQGLVTPYEKEIVNQDGQRIPVLVAVVSLDDARSELAVSMVDLTRLRRTEDRYRMLTNFSPQIVWISDARGEAVWCNERWYDYTGFTPGETLGKGWFNAIAETDRSLFLTNWEQLACLPESCELELRLVSSTGETRWFLFRGVPRSNSRQEIVEWIGTMTDIHDQRETAEELREADRRKDQFLATLSHELRNPLTPISNAIEMWRLRDLSREELAETREMLGRQVRQMVRLIDDLLELSRITRDKIQLRPEIVDARTLMRSAVETAQPLIEQHRHRLHLNLPAGPVWFYVDPARIVQAVSNLLNNAAKYTSDDGEISLSLWQVDQKVMIKVEDNGSGIPPEMIDRVFQMFEQVGSTLERSQGGLGIGLTLVQSLIEKHGGTITARSDGLGMGSAFTITLRVCDPPETTISPSDAPPTPVRLPRRKILVVDDVVASAKTLAMMLKAIGQDVDYCHDGPTAIDYVMKKQPEVVFLDIAMPGMDGFEVARRLRAEGFDSLLVALTGFGQQEDREQAFQAGFNHHLTKPTSLDALKQILGSPRPEAKPPASATLVPDE